MDFMNNVLSELQKQNLTQIEFCESIGISINTFRGWVSKKVQPPVDAAYKIAQKLNTTVDQLVSGMPVHPAEKKLAEIKMDLESLVEKI